MGQVYRNKAGTQPADAVKKILAQLDGAEQMSLGEWVQAMRSKPKAVPTRRQAKPKREPVNLDQTLVQLERAEGQAELRSAIARLALSAGEWKALAKKLTGRAASSGKAARELIETHLSDQLLLDGRVKSVKQQFNPATPRPAAS